MAGWAMTLYGSDTDETSLYPDESTITGHSDVVSYSFTAQGVFPSYEAKDEVVEYLGGQSSSQQRYRLKYDITIRPVDFPSSTTGLETFYPTSVLGKAFHWIKFGTFELIPTGVTTGKVYSIAVNGMTVEHDSDLGVKNIKIQAIARELI